MTACVVVLAGYAALMVAAVRFNRAERARTKNAGPSIPADRHGSPAVPVAPSP